MYCALATIVWQRSLNYFARRVALSPWRSINVFGMSSVNFCSTLVGVATVKLICASIGVAATLPIIVLRRRRSMVDATMREKCKINVGKLLKTKVI